MTDKIQKEIIKNAVLNSETKYVNTLKNKTTETQRVTRVDAANLLCFCVFCVWN